MERKKVPNIVGVSLDEAKEILEKANIEIEKEKKKIDIFEKSGTVVKVEPKEETSLKKNEKVVLYVSDRKPILIIILLFLLCAFLGRTSLGKTIIRGAEDKVIRVLNLSKPTAPEITGGSKEWSQSQVVKVKKDSYAKKGLAYYEYCVGTNLNKCVWKKTNTKNVRVSKTGKWRVVFRGVDKEGNTSSNSNIEEVYIDNNNPIINKVSVKNKKVKIEAIDKESGIKKYYYSIDGENYKETRKEFEIKDKTEKISIKVEDKAGNKTIVEVPVEKENEINSTSTTTKVVGEKTTTTNESTTKKPTDVTNPETSTTTSATTSTIKPTSTTTKKGLEYDIPKINLDKVPVEFVYGSEYELPSYVDFGNDEGTYKCVVEGKEEKTTKNLAIGKHLIVCEATSKHNKRTMVEKEVEVKVKSGEEEIWDGWIRLNLSYPDNSTNWEWRIGKEGEIRDGYEYTGWQDYTGPILVKLDDVKDVYIRYDLLGETYIIAPNGKVAVDIEPAKYALKGNEKTKVKIVYEKNVETKEYRIAGGEWEDYTGEFEVEKNTLIEARGIRNEKVYDSDGNYLYTKKVTGTDSVFIGEENATSGGTTSGGDKGSFEYEVVVKPNGSYTKPKKDTLPSTYLEGPEIKVSPTEMTESVIVKVIPKEKASKTYIKVGDGNYQEYTGEINVSKNVLIRAYYIREEDGKTSETSYYYIQNIKKASKPYVRIDATPDYLSEKVDKVIVKISGSNYTKLEYSLDGVIYEEYKGELTVEESQTIYAKGTNEFGETIESLDITTRTSPKEKENIEISIEVSPRKEEIEGLINKAKVKITYEKKATKRYYKLGYYGEWKEYTGEFEITDNETIYAYATGDNAVGNARKSVEYLTTGIASPIISIEPYGKSQQVKVSIEYASTAEITRYKIGNGEYRDYNGPFYVYESETIYAYNKDELGNTGTSEYRIKNIVSAPNYVSIDKGKYYIIKLHYPETSGNREYKWKSDGTWKSYNGYGILLIKPEYKEEFKDIKDGIKVEDEYGKEIIFTDHYYFIDVPFSELMENLFMRWDTEKISAPKIIEIPEEVTREASISIVYNKALVKKLYKIVYEDGEETEWLTYEKPFKIDKNKATIYAKGITRSESESKVGSKTITNIDDTDPEIRVKGNFEKAARQINVTVNAIDEFGIDKVKWAKGEQTKEYFKKNGNGIRNGSSFKVEENGKYTIYAVDYVGNEVIKVIEITNIDKEAPNIRINILTESYGTEAEIEIEYGDSIKKEYKIGKNGSYKEYTGTIKITSNEVLDLVNEDGSLTIYGRGTDEAGNVSEVSEDVYILDLDAPAIPEITAAAGYPILTEYGVKLRSKSYIKYDNRDDIINYYSIDNGATWKVYTGPFEITSGTIKAKSIKKESGLTIEATKKVDMPSDALGPEAYDGDNNTTSMSGYLNVSSNMWNKKVEIVDAEAQYGTKEKIAFLDGNDNILLSKSGINKSQIIEIPENTYRIRFTGGGNGDSKARIREVNTYNQPELNINNYYPTITEYGVEQAYNEVTIDYFSTSVQRLYRINDGEWKEYQDKAIRLELNDKIEAKGIDKKGIDTNVTLYVSELVNDALGPEAYDGDNNTTSMSGYLNVSSNMWNKYINVIDAEAQYGTKEKIEFLDGNDNILLSKSGINKSQIIEIPENTYRIRFTGGGSGYSKARIREVLPSFNPVVNEQNYYPTIRQTGITMSYIEAKITYLSYFAKKLYSLDNGTTWLDYKGIINVKAGDVILAKAIDKAGNETEVSTYTVKGLTDNLDDKAFDKDQTTSVTLSSKKTKSFILESVDNEVLRIYTTGTVNVGAYIKFYDKDNQELSTVTLNTDLTTLVIPEGSVKASIYSGTSALTINEVNLREVKAAKENYPEITINDANWTTTKAVEILYPEGTEREYSLDLGTTWNKYTNELTIDKETTIFARSIKEGKIISTNSFIITKVDNVKPIVELQLPSKIYKTFEFKLPTSYIAGSSGANVECRVGNNKVTTTKDLGIGTHEISCTIENGIGIKTEINKTIEIYELPKDSITDFDYTGGEQTYTASKSGIYFIETWGASGGCSLTDGKQTCKDIGYGGYSSGTISLTAGNTLYINVGGKGTDGIRDSDSPGGYNGGGNGVWDTDDDESAGGGGGATHIALRTGLLSTLENYKNDIIMVSGGGGGKSYTFVAGSGGGYKGAITSHTNQSEISQDKGYLFGKGQDANGAISIYGVAGGGGGFYGGYMNKSGSKTSGSGGSGYIGNTLLKNKSMYCYNCEESSEESTKTIKTTKVSETPTSKYAKIGNGYARITYIGEKFDITEFVSNFDYTGEEQTYTASKSGIYLIETWGASGGCALNNGVTNCTKISYGGYSSGTTFLTAGNTLYINVGGKGTDGILKSNSPGGYNGGGYGTWDNSDDESSGGGGGATHIALRTGLLSTLENYKNDILVVSGGGGGQSWTYAAGSGGGYKGVTTSTTNQSEVLQDRGYAFGKGQDAKGTASNDGVGGGGGGFYGGYMNNVGGKSSGSGGSGYIGNTLLKNKSMYCYNCEESSEESTKTIKTIDVSEIPTSKYSKIGNGYARITYMGE